MTRLRPRAEMALTAVLCIVGAGGCETGLKPASSGCFATGDVSGSPSTIDEAVGMANAMMAEAGQPVTLPCFLERLDRPLKAMAVLSLFSLQPSVGKRSPRIFLFAGNLVMSVVPAGDGRDLLELAEYTAPTRSIKAEVQFPVGVTLSASEPYDRVRQGAKTVCGGCHRSEQSAQQVSVTQGFESDVLRPRGRDEVPLPFLLEETRLCEPEVEPERCEMLNALFAHGEVQRGAFSADAHTIFE